MVVKSSAGVGGRQPSAKSAAGPRAGGRDRGSGTVPVPVNRTIFKSSPIRLHRMSIDSF